MLKTCWKKRILLNNVSNKNTSFFAQTKQNSIHSAKQISALSGSTADTTA